MNPEVIMHKALDLQVCVPKEFSDFRVKEFADKTCPAGTENGWKIIRKGDKYLGGAPERVPCDTRPENVHVRLSC